MAEPEALEWLVRNKNRSPLASNRFRTKEEAIEAVKALYAAGATRVELTPYQYDEPARVEKEGGPYADALVVIFPRERVREILALIKKLNPEDIDSYNDLLKRKEPLVTTILSWD